MKRLLLTGFAVLSLIAVLPSQVVQNNTTSQVQPSPVVSFTENKGQVADQNGNPRPDVRFSGTTSGMAFHLRNNGISYELNRVDSWKSMDIPGLSAPEATQAFRTADQITTYRIDLNWLGANTAGTITTENQLPGTNSYYFPVCPDGVLGVRSFEGVVYRNVYNKIDLHYYSSNNSLKYDFIVAPGGDYKNIRAQVNGATEIEVMKDGSLLYKTPLGNIAEGAPVVYQNGGQLTARWIVKGNTLEFEIDGYNPNAELIIDPATRTWGTYYGGTGADQAYRTRTDLSGNIFIAGWTTSATGIATAGSYQSTSAGNTNIYLAKFNSAGVRQWGTYVGNNAAEQAYGCAVDASGNVFICGDEFTTGTEVASAGCHQPTFGGGTSDAFLMKFSPTGAKLWGTHYGGATSEIAYSCATTASGDVVMVGYTTSNAPAVFATAGCHQPAYGGGVEDGFVAKFNASGVRQWGTFYGGGLHDRILSCAIDASGNIFLSGYTISTGGIATAGSHQTANGGLQDCMLIKLNASGARQWSTYYGSAGNDTGGECSVDASGNVYFCGNTAGSTGTSIATAGSHQPTLASGAESFLAKFNTSGVRQWGTYYGGAGVDQGIGCVTDAAGYIYFCGMSTTTTANVISTAGSHQPTSGGGNEAFLVQFNSSGVRQWGTYYGGAGAESGYSVTIDVSNNIILSGVTGSNVGTEIATAGSHQPTYAGSNDGFIATFFNCNSSAAPTNTTSPTSLAICYNTSTTLTATGGGTLGWYTAGTGGTYLGGGGSFTTAALTATTSFYVQDSSGCAVSSRTQITVTVNPQITSSATSIVNISCNGGSNGAATVVPGGGTSPYTYSWAPSGGTAASISGRTAGVYTCTITDASGCTRTQTVNLTQPTALSSSVASLTNNLCNGASTGAATVSVSGGAGSYTYSWAPSGGTAATATGLAANTYTCTITDGNGCTRTQTVSITHPTAMASSVSSQTNISCNGGTNGAATISVSGGAGAYTYSWAPSGGTSSSISGRTAGTYTCTITDANGCTRTQTVALTQPTAIASTVSAQTNVSCNGGSNGAATVTITGGAPGYSYSWAPSGGTSASISGRTAGAYTCTVTDANGCTITQSVNITQPTAITSSITSQTNVACNGGNNGSATVNVSGGAGGYTYIWSPSGGTAATATGLAAATYTCTITDVNGCTRQQTVTLTQPGGMTASVASQTNVACNGGTNGSASISVTGGAGSYTYSWTPSGGTGSSVTNRTAGVYTCTITDANGCTTTQTVNITQPSAIVTSITSQTNVTCNGANNGTATVSANGGTPSYTYSWSPSGGTSASASGLAPNTYTCTITDANGCTQTQSVVISEPSAVTASVASQSDPLCNAGTDGTATVNASGGTGALTYSWSPAGGNAATATGIGAGSYTCTVTDANGCTQTTSATLSEPSAISTSASFNTDPTCNGGTDGSMGVFAMGGTGSYTYNWLPSGGNAASATGLSAGTYTCTVTDANSCTATFINTLSQPAAIASSQTVAVCFGDSFTVGSNTYNATGIYTDVLTSINGCDSTVTTDLTVNTAIDITTTTSLGTISANQNGANYQWIDCLNGNAPVIGATNQTFTPTVNGDYAVIVTVGSCSDTSACSNVITGIENTAIASFSLYPNPTNGLITIQTGSVNNATIEVFNAVGQLVLTEKANSSAITLQLPEENGMYLIRVTANGSSSTQRVIKQ
ncbi:MAG: hypothetical protein RL007_1303 [Bacteroidota bacterium]|jgi:hypothetical protein